MRERERNEGKEGSRRKLALAQVAKQCAAHE